MTTESKNYIEQVKSALKGKKIEHIYLVACGGSKAFMDPAQYIFDMETAVPAQVYSSNEFCHRMPKGLGDNSIVISCSHSGNTPETVEATKLARQKGALTIALSNLVDSPLWKEAEVPVKYDWKDCDFSDGRYSMLYSVTFSVLNEINSNEKYARAIAALDSMQAVNDRAKEAFKDRANIFGRTHRDDKLIYTMGSGSQFGCAYSFAICLLMEMSWVHSNGIHSGEYFHGPFEITDTNVPFLMLKSIDSCRPLDERAEKFCKKYSERVTTIDAAEFDMNEIPEDLREYFGVLVTDTVLREYAECLADHRGHPLSVRRYMWRMEY